jgi:hypothetical protein
VQITRAALQKPDPMAMRGFARRFRAVKATSEWLRELREAESDH